MEARRRWNRTISANLAALPWLMLSTLGVAYLLAMVVYPCVASGFDWVEVQHVWRSWQGLNVGVLAFASSLIALRISQQKTADARDRDFRAAKAFLVEAADELSVYLESCASRLRKAWYLTEQGEKEEKWYRLGVAYDPPSGYRDVFARSISLGDSETSRYLIDFILLFQRLRASLDGLEEDSTKEFLHRSYYVKIIECWILSAQLHVKVDGIFKLSRDSKARLHHMDWEDLRNSYSVLNIPYELHGIEQQTKEFLKSWDANERELSCYLDEDDLRTRIRRHHTASRTHTLPT